MKLSAEQFTELAATFNAQHSPNRHERRRAARMELQARVKITPVISGQRLAPIQIMICDFSARGVSFIHPETMEIGRQFILELPRKGGGSLTLLCVVAHSQAVGNNVYRIGSEFTGALQGGDPPSTAGNDAEEMKRIRESMLR